MHLKGVIYHFFMYHQVVYHKKNMKVGIFLGFFEIWGKIEPIFWKMSFWKSAKNGHFHHKRCIFAPKNKKIENVFQAEIFNIFYYNLAKFQVSSTYLSWLLFKNVILSYRAFKSPRDSFFEKSARFCPIFRKILKIFQLSCFFMVYYLVVHEKMTNNTF